MKRRPLKRNKKTGSPKWMVTYADMVTLILVFFILLFSMSQLDQMKFEAVSNSFKDRTVFEFNPSAVPLDNPDNLLNENNSGELNRPEQTNNFSASDDDQVAEQKDSLNKLMTNVEQYLDRNELNNVISASRNERGVVLVLQELILFEPGEADILQSGEPFLNKISSLLAEIPNQVKVEGHTDNKPMSSFRFPSNWELSGARASSVVRYLVNKHNFDESRFTIVGYSDTKPLAPNDSPENMSKNRRVEIVILENNSNPNS
ncbi:flagellar motor protein MotS [Virgibacillus flavescens]|uniref:flagellar motor protein MotS n=1 Tax=Virgibacillus flavescens TaxID=1611422 RepID=UPI003D34E59E